MSDNRKAYIYVRNDFAGLLLVADYGYIFEYDREYLNRADASPVSLTLPLRADPYISQTMFSFFDGLIPEGWLFDHMVKCRKPAPGDAVPGSKDRFGLLLATCPNPIGNVSVRREKV